MCNRKIQRKKEESDSFAAMQQLYNETMVITATRNANRENRENREVREVDLDRDRETERTNNSNDDSVPPPPPPKVAPSASGRAEPHEEHHEEHHEENDSDEEKDTFNAMGNDYDHDFKHSDHVAPDGRNDRQVRQKERKRKGLSVHNANVRAHNPALQFKKTPKKELKAFKNQRNESFEQDILGEQENDVPAGIDQDKEQEKRARERELSGQQAAERERVRERELRRERDLRRAADQEQRSKGEEEGEGQDRRDNVKDREARPEGLVEDSSSVSRSRSRENVLKKSNNRRKKLVVPTVKINPGKFGQPKASHFDVQRSIPRENNENQNPNSRDSHELP